MSTSSSSALGGASRRTLTANKMNATSAAAYVVTAVPQVTEVSPVEGTNTGSTSITIRGADFLNDPVPPTVSLVIEGDPTPNPIQNVTWVDAETLVGTVQPALVAPGLYDLRFVNSDGQRIERVDFVEVAGP